MPEWVLRELADALNARGKAVHGSRILILGIAYKKNVDDMRESLAVEMMEYLREQGAVLAYSDPHVSRFPRMREHQFDLEHTPISEETLAGQDCVLIATDHAAVDYDLVLKHAPLVVDTRGVYRDRNDPKIVRA